MLTRISKSPNKDLVIKPLAKAGAGQHKPSLEISRLI
jgi:hypothetical protein